MVTTRERGEIDQLVEHYCYIYALLLVVTSIGYKLTNSNLSTPCTLRFALKGFSKRGMGTRRNMESIIESPNLKNFGRKS